MPDKKEKCDLAGDFADRACIGKMLIYLLVVAFLLPAAFIYSWISLQEAIEEAGASHLMNNVVATVGGKTLFAVKMIEVKDKEKKEAATATPEQPSSNASEVTTQRSSPTDPDSATPQKAQVTSPVKYILVISDSFAVLIVFISGAFGGFIHAARSYYYHVHKGDLQKSKAIELFLRPFTGGTLALIFYLVLRAGLSQSPSQPGEKGASIIFYTAVAAIVGMFTDQTVAKLKKIAEAILSPPEEPDKEDKVDAKG